MDVIEKDIDKFNKLIKELEEFRKKLIEIDYIHQKKEFFDTMRDFRRYLVSMQSEDKLYNLLYHSKYYRFYEEFFTDINMYYIRSVESVQSLSIMTKWLHNFSSFAELMDIDFIKQWFETKWNEIKHLDFTDKKTLVMVWSWALPETLLYIYENTSIENIIWVDKNHEAIFMAWEMVSWLNVDKITFHQSLWEEYDFSEADIVYMPLFTYPKNKVLDRIVETWKDDVQILISIPKWFWNLLFENFSSDNINPQLKIKKIEDASTTYIAQDVIKLEKYNI